MADARGVGVLECLRHLIHNACGVALAVWTGLAQTLEDLASEFGVSRERIRQIEVRAFEKLQKAVRDQAASMNLLPQEDMAGLLSA